MSDIIQLSSALGPGDPHAANRLLPLVYAELRRLAAQRSLSTWGPSPAPYPQGPARQPLPQRPGPRGPDPQSARTGTFG
jgi:hypothetical protein